MTRPQRVEWFNADIGCMSQWCPPGGGVTETRLPNVGEYQITSERYSYESLQNPDGLTGAGYLGPWVLRDSAFGSAHSQYTDVLFRTGVIGLLLYLGILVGLMRYLWRSHEGLFWGVASVLVYGLFHETFKESQGAFVIAFLVGLMAQSSRDRRAVRRRSKPVPSVGSLVTASQRSLQANASVARDVYSV